MEGMTTETATAARVSRTRLWAALSLITGVFVFSLQDVILKYSAKTYPLPEAVAIRSTVGLIILIVFIQRTEGLGRILSPRLILLILRALILLVAYGAYYMALPAMDLAQCVTLFFMAPIFITLLAYPFLGERAELSHWLAILVGFAGVVVTYWPKFAGSAEGVAFDWALLLPVVAALAYGLAQLMARRFKADSAAVQGFHQNLMFLIGALALGLVFSGGGFDHAGLHPSLAFLMRDWIYGSGHDLALLAACGLIAAVGTVLLSQAYRMAEANFVASFEYTGLIWGTGWGYLLWHEVPTLWMLAGAALIIGAGLYMLFGGRKAAGAE
jgi:drug/metabolite transporter (DMT)-like permease